MFLRSVLSLTESLANVGKSNFESILREELRREYASLPLESFIRQGESPDGDSVKIRIEKVDSVRFPDRVYITVHVLFDATNLVKKTEATRRHCEGRFTVVLNPGSDGRKEPEAYHEFDTRELYPVEDELPPLLSDQEEAQEAEWMDGAFRKLEASTLDAQYPADVRKFIGIVQRKLKRPHSAYMHSFLADLRRRLDLLPHSKGDDA